MTVLMLFPSVRIWLRSDDTGNVKDIQNQAARRNTYQAIKKPGTTAQAIMTSPRGPCQASEKDMYKCWIGEDMLSRDGPFYKILKSKANSQNIIYLASVDSSFIDMAVNMYQTSFKKFNMKHFLYICSDRGAVALLAKHGIDCFLYTQSDTKNKQATEYGSADFIKKMRVKMKMVTASLLLGFTTVLTDLDIVFFRDPTSNLLSDSDISLMSDVTMDNCGFYIARPTPASIELHIMTLKEVMTRLIADQDAIAGAIRTMTASHKLKKISLDKTKFACGLVYFENKKRMFRQDNPCVDRKCITDVVHNNWIVSKAAKIYRFKETGLWMYEQQAYYSNASQKYLQFGNPLDFGPATRKDERNSLKTALTIAKLLNRTLILPKFHCQGCKYGSCKISNDHCAFNTDFHVRTFDNHFMDQYREHVFLEHSLVPEVVKKSVSPVIFFSNKKMADKLKPTKDMKTFNTSDYDAGRVTSKDILSWFGQGPLSQFSVLMFHSLYIDIAYDDKPWDKKLESALKWSDYRQYKILG